MMIKQVMTYESIKILNTKIKNLMIVFRYSNRIMDYMILNYHFIIHLHKEETQICIDRILSINKTKLIC